MLFVKSLDSRQNACHLVMQQDEVGVLFQDGSLVLLVLVDESGLARCLRLHVRISSAHRWTLLHRHLRALGARRAFEGRPYPPRQAGGEAAYARTKSGKLRKQTKSVPNNADEAFQQVEH